MVPLIVSVYYVIANLFLGYAVLHLLGYKHQNSMRDDPWELNATAFLLGGGMISNLWIFIGLAHWLTPIVVAGALGLCLVAGLPFVSGMFLPCIQAGRDLIHRLTKRDGAFLVTVAFAAGLLVILAVGAFLRPPVWDAEAFYMAYPKIIAASQRLTEMPGLYANFSQIGLLGEMHFAALFSLGGPQAAKLFVWVIAVSAVVVLVTIARWAGVGLVGCGFVLVLVVTSTAFTNHITDGKVDLFATATGLGAFYWALRTGEAGERAAALRLAGILAGMAMIAKFSYIPAFLPSVFLLVAWATYSASQRIPCGALKGASGTVVAFASLGLWMAIAAIPHMIKNGVLFGAPLAPFLGAEDTAWPSWLNQTWFSSNDTRWIVMTYPLALAFGRYPLQGGNLSFLLIAFLPLAFLVGRPASWVRSPLVQITTAGILGTLTWIILRPSIIAPRYILAPLLLLVPLIAMGAEHVYEMEQRPRLLSKGVILTMIITLAILSFPYVKLPVHLLNYVRGTLPACALASPYCEPLTALNERAAPGDRVYFAGYFSYWLRPDLLQCRDDRQDWEALGKVNDGVNRWTELYARGFRYVVVDWTTHAEAHKALWSSAPPPWLDAPEVIKTPELSIFGLSPQKGAPKPQLDCVQASPPGWDVRQTT